MTQMTRGWSQAVMRIISILVPLCLDLTGPSSPCTLSPSLCCHLQSWPSMIFTCSPTAQMFKTPSLIHLYPCTYSCSHNNLLLGLAESSDPQFLSSCKVITTPPTAVEHDKHFTVSPSFPSGFQQYSKRILEAPIPLLDHLMSALNVSALP